MPDQTPGEIQTNERRVGVLYERLAALEKVVELAIEAKSQALDGKGGVLDRLEHLDRCIDGLKKTVWMATGAIMIVSVIMNLVTRSH